ncbi:MAG: hypothetical protein SF051_11835, partial [Elusimicrobiota bacterium]|nr:hypothetical protein [Elusimicrobiota bacterium]
AAAAASAQGTGRASIEALRAVLEDATRRLGHMPAAARGRADDALDEAARAEAALNGGDTAEGLQRAEAALAALQDGQGQSGEGEGEGEGMGEGLTRPFGGAGGTVRVLPGAGGGRGASTGGVRLPRADEYRPPRRLREELERSRLEPRPAARDESVKEYFRRLSR